MDRLALDPGRLAGIASDVRTIAALPDPVGETLDGHRLPNGLDVQRVRVPLGVVAVVYEARPNVTIDCSALCLKSGNAIVLRGSSMAANSNAVLAQVAPRERSRSAGLPAGPISLVTGGDRDELRELATQDGVVDLIIPRGGEGLKNALKEHATVPVMYAAAGNCHVYVDATADLDDARRDHRQRQGAAARRLQRGRDAAGPRRRRAPSSCRARCPRCARPGSSCGWTAAPAPLPGRWRTRSRDAAEEDWDTEYLALILAVKVVDSIDGGDRARQPLRLGPLGGDRHRLDGVVAGVHRRGRRGLRLRQRLDSLHRRRGVRHGRRDRQLHTEAARARPDRRCASSPRYKFVVEGSGQVRRVGGLRLGIFGGTFNPPHIGHLVCAQEARSQLGLDRVSLMPVGRGPPPRDRGRPGRRGALRDVPAGDSGTTSLEVSDLEVDREGPSYTVDTLAALRERAPDDELTLILGADQAAAPGLLARAREGAGAGDRGGG